MNSKVNEFDLRVTSEIERKNAKKDFSRIGFGFVIFSGISVLVSLVIQIAVLSVSEDFYNSHLFRNLITPVSMYLFALPVLVAFFSGVKPMPPEKKKIRFPEFMAYVAVGFGLMYIGAFMGNGVMSWLSEYTGNDYSNALEEVVNGNLWVTALFVVIIAPIGEEFVFRKLLIDRTHKYGSFISAILSGLIFGLMHGNIYQFFYAALLGLLLGYIYSNTGNIKYCIAIHAIINFIGSVVSVLLTDALGDLINATEMTNEQLLEMIVEKWPWFILMMAFSLLVYASMGCAIILPLAFRRKIKLCQGDTMLSRKELLSVAFTSAGIICMVIFYVVEFMLTLLPV